MIYIQIHFTTHGIAYFKHILSHYFIHPPTSDDISGRNLNQEDLNKVFDKPNENGFSFDRVYYLFADQHVFDQISSIAQRSREKIYKEDELVKKLGIEIEWKEIIDCNLASLEEEIEWINKSYKPKIKEQLISAIWRNIQHYPILDQLYWFQNISNAGEIYNSKKFTPVNLSTDYGLQDLRDHKQIIEVLNNAIRQIAKENPGEELLVNISLGSYETQVAWFVLAENNVLPDRTRFISSYDDKTFRAERFKHFDIKEVPTKLFNQLVESVTIFEKTKSKKRELANMLIKKHMKMGFSILLLGERGVGKSRLAELNSEGRRFFPQNCAAFDDDTKAESALFGYVKGAFTGAEKETEGLFQTAKGGVLFLDEVHHLSKMVQGKLMQALQTDSDNFFSIIKLGGTKVEKVKCTVIFASNLNLEELKHRLMPDFYDRISQLMIEIPSLRETKEDRVQDWKVIWKQLKFGEERDGQLILTRDKRFEKWLLKQQLFGNFRDLQKIAILYRSYQEFEVELKSLITETYGYNDAYSYVTEEFKKYYIEGGNNPGHNYLDTKSEPNQIMNLVRKNIVDWAERTYGSIPEAYEEFYKISKDTPRAKTLYEWKKLPMSN